MLKNLLLAAMLLSFTAAYSQTANPLLVHSNAPINYEKVDAEALKDAVNKTVEKCDQLAKNIISVPAGKQTVTNTLMTFDNLSFELGDLGGKVYLASVTFPDDKTRNEANNQLQKLSSYGSDLYLMCLYTKR